MVSDFGDDQDSSCSSEDDSPANPSSSAGMVPYPIKALMMFVMVWQFFFKVSNAGIRVLLLFLKSLIRAIGVAYHSPRIIDAAGTIPQTLSRASIMCNLDVRSSYQVYVVCTKCQSLFPK